jgi:hypothetical protein
MLNWLRKRSAPLSGAPAVRRQKTYSAQSGYVYQYFYEGQRRTSSQQGTEYVFNVSHDRKTSSQISVFINDEAMLSWQQESGRTLSTTEKYAIAKMALFQAFDERETPEAAAADVEVGPADVRTILASLNID